MSLPERHSPGDQIIGDIGRQQQPRCRGLAFRLVNFQAVDHAGQRFERGRKSVLGIEHRVLVFLQILVVSTRQPFQRGEPAGEMPDHSARLAANELERIGILLLRHHAAAGARRIRQLKKSVLVAAENNQIFRQPAQVHERQRARMQKRRNEIAIGGRVDAVGDDLRKPQRPRQLCRIDRVIGAGHRARSQRHRVGLASRPRETRMIASQRGNMRQKEMRDEHRLRAPQVRIGRHQRGAARARPPGQRRDHRAQLFLKKRNAPPKIQAQVERNLLVPRSAGMQSLSEIAHALDELPLDKRVHVLVRSTDE